MGSRLQEPSLLPVPSRPSPEELAVYYGSNFSSSKEENCCTGRAGCEKHKHVSQNQVFCGVTHWRSQALTTHAHPY